MVTGGAGPFLGIDTRSVHTAEALRNRYTLRRGVQGLLFRRGENANEQHRTCFCGRGVRDGQHGVSILRQAGGGKARYRGVTSCGDVWACPTCAAKIAGERRKELERAMVAAHLKGFHGYLLTLTFPHEYGMPLADIMGPFAKALQSFKNSRTYKGFMERHGRLGQVKALEVKHGGNGWHPHVHELVFAAPGLLEDVRGLDALRDAWVKALLKVGLGESDKLSDMLAHALDFRGGDDAAAYIAKYGHDERWGLSSEMTQHLKKVSDKGGHFSPFELAYQATRGDSRSAALFHEYVQAFKGKRALTWTRGLRRELLDGDELTDEQLAALDDPLPEDEHIGVLDLDRYQEILARKLEGELLYCVATWQGPMDQADLDELVDGWICNTPRRASGFVASIGGGGLKRLIEASGVLS
jgi:hypothetical protein